MGAGETVLFQRGTRLRLTPCPPLGLLETLLYLVTAAAGGLAQWAVIFCAALV